jgi:hypothetical protein
VLKIISHYWGNASRSPLIRFLERFLRENKQGKTVKQPPSSRVVAFIQGIFYLLTGLWPIFHMKTFEAVSGKKTDRWLVKTVSGLICLIGMVLLEGWRDGVESQHRRIGAGAAVWLAGIDVYYVMRRRISMVYLLDALVEVVLALSWFTSRPDDRCGIGRQSYSH